MSDYPTRQSPEITSTHAPVRSDPEADATALGPLTQPPDWLNLHPTNAPAAKPAEPSQQERKKTPSGSYIAVGGPLSNSATDASRSSPLLPKLVGPYEIIKELGRGGMGVVYLAKDCRLKRPVALKMILTGTYADLDQRERFLAEAQAVAQLKHPNIVQIYEIGEYEGHPYLALEYFDGGNMRQVCLGQPQDQRWAAQVVKTLAEAMEFAHNRGVIHRDLKPANILLQKDDDSTQNRKLRWGQRFPASSYVRHSSVKITDFGLAKFIAGSESAPEAEWNVYDLHADAIGTPQYMAPEQAQGELCKVGPAADIYSLGAILYDLLTGRPPFDGPTPRDTILRVVTEAVLPPSRLQPRIPRNLETICLKCLQKEPTKRYATAADLVADLRRFLTGEPIKARRTIFLYKGMQWARQRPAAAGLLLVMMLISLGALSVIGWVVADLKWTVALEQQGRASEAHARLQAETELRLALTESSQIRDLYTQERRSRQITERKLYDLLFTQVLGKPEGQRSEALRQLETRYGEFTDDHRSWEWHYMAQPEERRHAMIRPAQVTYPATVVGLAVTVEGHPLLIVLDPQKKVLQYFDGDSLKTERPLHEGKLHAADVCGNGQSLAVAYWNETARQGRLQVWDVRTQQLKNSWELPQMPIRLAWDAEAKHLGLLCGEPLALGGSGRLGVVDMTMGTLRWCDKPTPDAQGLVALMPRGAEVWTIGYQGSDSSIWTTTTGKVHTQHLGVPAIIALEISPDGQRIAVADAGGQVTLLDAVTGQPLLTLREKLPQLISPVARLQLAFSPDGRYLAALAGDGTILLWDSGKALSMAPR